MRILKTLHWSRRRSGSGVADIHLQQSQLQENNNGSSRDNVKGGGESRESRVEISSIPDEMWAQQGSSPGHHRELPVDVPDTLLEQAYANKQVMSLMLNRSETTSSSSSGYRQRSTDRIDETNFNIRSASDHHKNPDNRHQNRHQSNMLAINVKTTNDVVDGLDNVAFHDNSPERVDSPVDKPRVESVHAKTAIIPNKDDNQNHNIREQNQTLARIIEINVLNDNDNRDNPPSPLPKKLDDDIMSNDEDHEVVIKTIPMDKINPFDITDDEEDQVDADSPQLLIRDDVSTPSAVLLQKESSVDADEDYPFAKEDYPTMLKTCSDDSASPRSSSGRSDSTAPLDSSLILAGKESPLYDARRIDLGSPCRPLVPEIKIAPIFTRGRETTSFDNPAYGLADLHDLHQGLLMRSDEVTDLTRLIDEQQSLANGRKPRSNEKSAASPLWAPTKDHLIHQVHQIRNSAAPAEMSKIKKKSSSKHKNDGERLKSRSNRDELEIDGEGLLGAGSTDDLLNGELTNLTMTRSIKKKKQLAQQQHLSSGYSTLRSDASIADFPDQQIRSDRSFLVVGNRSYREVAVDCPADFVPVTKTHPVYPPPNRGDGTIDRNSTLQSLKNDGQEKNKSSRLSVFGNDNNVATVNQRSKDNVVDSKSENDDDNDLLRPHIKADDFRNEVVNALGRCQEGRQEKAGLNGVKPAIPPRDQKRAPARPPKDNLRLSTRNNNIEQTDNANTPEPTQQQLNSIRKYQEQLRKRKEEDERQEGLNRSLRASTQLKALESHATILSGQENPAYAQDEVTSAVTRPTHGTPGQTTPKEVEEPPKVLTYGEVVATLERLQLQLRNLSGALGISGPSVEAELEAVRTLLVQRRFATALATHQALKTRLRTGKVLKHHDDDASNLARDCVEVLEEWQSTSVGSGETRAMVEELTGLLSSYEMEGLLLAHDSIISYVDGIQRKQSPSSSSPSRSPSPSSSLRGSRNTDNIKIIRIEKTNEPLGATVRNEGDAVIIGRVVRGGAADKSGLFHEGDEVLEVNGVEMRGKSVNEVCDILAGMQGGLTFLVLPASANQRNNVNNTRREDGAQIQHVRAHFDYDPEEDPYIPCRELGVSFQKGDVLHVISQEDSNWWQAYREGEEDHTLAGLIPSRAFQHQRESVKQTFAGGKSTMRGSKKSSTLLCTRKNPKKKKKRSKFGPNFNDERYPLYDTTTIDDYDSEEVLTYEEVALYYPRANHKRPIVLIGPPNIGRHELRQRLMQDSERFAAAIPHTSRPRKGSEVDGQDYHFISRSQFESDILCRKFVEHGEYEKAYYGTSVEAIRSVVNSGKICVLNLHPQSLKILRSSDLKPYVVFVAPPSLEKLRQKRIKNNESFKEEELKDIIEKAREMEDKYGHLFDMIILNNDTDRAYNQLLTEINSLEREPQWVPASWVQ